MNDNSDRRNHARHAMNCPVEINDAMGRLLARSRTANVSDGGAYLPLPVSALPAFGSHVQLRLSVPRKTPNTFMYERFQVRAKVLRHQPLKDSQFAGVALQFEPMAKLGIDE